jgi:hypothetical protein
VKWPVGPVMHERQKLDEASYFMERMRGEQDSGRNFRFELSAFLAASRSVLQYAQRESSRIPNGRVWYNTAIERDPMFKFFKGLRDANIHTAPAKPTSAFRTEVAEYLRVDEDGKDAIIPLRHHTTSLRHTFTDWGNESAIELAERYLSALRRLIADGIAKKMISG